MNSIQVLRQEVIGEISLDPNNQFPIINVFGDMAMTDAIEKMNNDDVTNIYYKMDAPDIGEVAINFVHTPLSVLNPPMTVQEAHAALRAAKRAANQAETSTPMYED